MIKNTVLITRPEAESIHMQRSLTEIGINSLICPLLAIKPLPCSLTRKDYDGYDALIVTSKHTVPFIKKNIALPIISIGEKTTLELKKHGFKVAESAAGNSNSLKILLDKSSLQNYMHLGGLHLSDNFKDLILNSSLKITHIPVYTAEALDELPLTIIKSILQDEITTILFFSGRSLKIFDTLIKNAGLTERLGNIQALFLATSVLKSGDKKIWRSVRIAKQPTAEAMIEELIQEYEEHE